MKNDVLLIGLTGSIGMGKSETAKMFARLGVPVYDADAAVHELYAPGGAAVAPLEEAFPGTVKDGMVDREELSKRVLGKPDELKKLEAIVHPLVGEAQRAFLQKAMAEDQPMVLLDIPLLFETGGRERVDVIVVVSAPYDVQHERVLARPGMTAEKFDAIHAKQVPDAEKRAGADFIVETDKGLEHAFEQVKEIVNKLQGRPGKILPKMLAQMG
ncbi:dephospho-CoA kinase [Tepidicaulis marinus]|uniref:Dephospho-CoA kinase n=1 Tax=Tepidicaulis marinus TaxID=1333998 RepID=A0A081B6P4_9HYPH|nr:dephospho-CoA kinase [Tepidicaulis marinus]